MQRIWTAAKNNPDKVIIKDATRMWTWRDLLWRAKTYADALTEACDSPVDAGIVPILVDRSGETVAAILGTLIAGRGFSPLSPQQPLSRLTQCFDALNAKVVISTNDATPLTATGEAQALTRLVVEHSESGEGLPIQPRDFDASQILYVLFTSGSTGVPKGVMADLSNIENTMLWSMDMINWTEDDVIGGCTNFYFDISMFDVFTLFYFNVPLAIYSNPSDVAQVVFETEAFKITSIFGVPTFFSQILRTGMLGSPSLAGLRRVIAGGDFFPPAHILGWREMCPTVDIYNVWGPTETSIVNTMHMITAEDELLLQQGKSAPVGREHPRMPFCLVDESLNVITAPNKRGEICMLGACVTRGYLGDMERTRQAYIDVQNMRAFRTNDLGHIDEYGNLFIAGRMGSMVKVAGHRVDLGEVESAASLLNDIHQACAFVVDIDAESGERELWMALELKDAEKKLDVYSIKKSLRASLPHYMVPKRVVALAKMPVNQNGKIDRSALARLIATETEK